MNWDGRIAMDIRERIGTGIGAFQATSPAVRPAPDSSPAEVTRKMRKAPGMENFLSHPTGAMLEKHSGDACSLLGIAGATLILASRRLPNLELAGQYSVLASMGAAAVDTTIQVYNQVHDGGAAAAKRGAADSGLGTIVYAATGLIPGASLKTLGAIRHIEDLRTAGKIGALGVNGAVVGYETLHRTPKIVKNEENWSGYASFVAALGGFVVARHAMRLPHIPVPHLPLRP